MELYIFRHGETNVTKNHLGSYGDEVFTAPILEEFIPSLEKMGEYLKNISSDNNYSSEILRCKQTVDVVSKVSGKQFIFDSRINEVAPGESISDISSRVSDFLKSLDKDKTIMVCSHGAIIAAIVSLKLKNNFTDFDYLNFPDPGIVWQVTDRIQEVFKI